MPRNSQGMTGIVEAMTVGQRNRLFSAGLGVVLTPLWMLPLLMLQEIPLTWMWISALVFIVFAGLFMMLPKRTVKFIEAIGGLVARVPVPFVRRKHDAE